MYTYNDIVVALAMVLGDTPVVQAVKGWEAEFSALLVERDAAVNRAAALGEALMRSEAFATDLVNTISKVREDAADGILDNPIPEVIEPVVVAEPVVDPDPAVEPVV